LTLQQMLTLPAGFYMVNVPREAAFLLTLAAGALRGCGL